MCYFNSAAQFIKKRGVSMKRICLEFYFYREVGPGYFDSFGQLLVNSKRKSNAFRLKAMMQAAL